MLTRTDRGRFPIRLAVIAALTLAMAMAVAMAMLFSTVQAQESGTLLSNNGQTKDGELILGIPIPPRGSPPARRPADTS